MRKTKKIPNLNSLGSASRRASTERRKTKKKPFLRSNADWLFPRVDYTERKKTKRKNVKFIRICRKETFNRERKNKKTFFLFFTLWLCVCLLICCVSLCYCVESVFVTVSMYQCGSVIMCQWVSVSMCQCGSVTMCQCVRVSVFLTCLSK